MTFCSLLVLHFTSHSACMIYAIPLCYFIILCYFHSIPHKASISFNHSTTPSTRLLMFRTFRSVLSLSNTSLRIHPPSDTCVTELSFRFRIPERTHAVTEVVDVHGRVCLGVYTVSDAEKQSKWLNAFRIVRYVGRSETLGLRCHLAKYSCRIRLGMDTWTPK